MELVGDEEACALDSRISPRDGGRLLYGVQRPQDVRQDRLGHRRGPSHSSNEHSTSHSEAIVTEDEAAGERFLREIDSACVYKNASTRFSDGFEFGFGAEMGISTQKLHARGPMGLRELTSYKFVIRGNGQVRA